MWTCLCARFLLRGALQDLPLVARPFVSATVKATEAEVGLLTVQASRPPIRMKVVRRRAEFGARYTFSDKESDGAGASCVGVVGVGVGVGCVSPPPPACISCVCDGHPHV